MLKCKNRFELHNKIIEKEKVKNIKSNYISIQKVKEKWLRVRERWREDLPKKDNDKEKGKSRGGKKKDDIKRKSLENGCC